MGPRGLVAIVVLCVVAAGCSALPGGPPGRATTDTVTPVPVTTVEPTQTPPEEYPPGVFANGSITVQSMVNVHETYIADRSYSWRFSYVARHPNGTVVDNFSRRVRVGDEAFLVDQETTGLGRNQSLYVGESAYLRTVRAGETGFEQVSDPMDHRSYAFAGEVIDRFLTGVTVDVTVVTRNGRTYYRLYNGGLGIPPSLHQFGADTWDYSVTAYVTPEGFVRTIAVDYSRDGAGGERRIRTRFDYTDVGSTTVSDPEWVSRLRKTETATAKATEAGTDGPGPANGTPSPPAQTTGANQTSDVPTVPESRSRFSRP